MSKIFINLEETIHGSLECNECKEFISIGPPMTWEDIIEAQRNFRDRHIHCGKYRPWKV